MPSRTRLTVSILLVALIRAARQAAPCKAGENSGPALNVQTTQNTTKVPLYEILEISFQHENGYADTDDDNDGYSDRDERRRGTDPLDALSFPG